MWPFGSSDKPERITEDTASYTDSGILKCPKCGDAGWNLRTRNNYIKLRRWMACENCGHAAEIAEGVVVSKDE